LIEGVGVEREIEESFRVVAGVDSVVNELVEERRFPGTPSADESENRLVFELAAGLVGTCEMVEIALLASWE
jgi:hypothetical protein